MFNSHFKKKSIYILLFSFFSCGDNLEKLTNQKSFQEIYTALKEKEFFYPKDRVKTIGLHNQFLRACQNDKEFRNFIKDHVDKKDIMHCVELRDYIKTVFDQKSYCYTAKISEEEVKDVYQICLVPGFFIRTIDNYTPMIAHEIVDFLKTNNPNCVIKTDIVSRWDGYIKEHDDNTDFDTQYDAMKSQITEHTDALKKKYQNAQVHLIFVGESFGGKITLFFLNKYLSSLQDNRITIDRFITVHSPLYGMELAKYVVENSNKIMDLYDNQAFILLLSAIQFEFLNVLNVNHYMHTFDLLSKDNISGFTTDQALQNLINHKIQILNFIGTPNDVVIGGNKIQYQLIVKFFNAVKGWFFKQNENGDFERNADGKNIFLEQKWDTFDHTLSSLSEIILQLKYQYQASIANDIVDQKLSQNLKNIIDRENVYEIKEMLFQVIAPMFNEERFEELDTAYALKSIAIILNDFSNFFTKTLGDSDMVVKVDEITKNKTVLSSVKNSRDEPFFISDEQGQSFISSPNINHAFEHGNIPQFNDDLEKFFRSYLVDTSNFTNTTK